MQKLKDCEEESRGGRGRAHAEGGGVARWSAPAGYQADVNFQGTRIKAGRWELMEFSS